MHWGQHGLPSSGRVVSRWRRCVHQCGGIWLRHVVVVVALAASFASCELLPAGDDGQVTITFALPEAVAGETSPNVLLAYRLESDADPLRFEVRPGSNEVEVPSGATYLFGLVRAESAASGAVRTRSIGSAIQTIGTIAIVANDLETLPAATDSPQDINYGALERTDGGYASTANPASIAEALNLDPAFLSEMGNSDDLLVKILNPDIDQDGVYDSDQGLEWNFMSFHYFAMSYGNADFDSATIPYAPSDLSPIVTKYIFRATSGFPSLASVPNSQVRLYLPPESNAVWNDGSRVEYMIPNASDDVSTPGDIWFPQDPTERADTGTGDRVTGGIPFDGDYRLQLGADEYVIRNADFVKPADNYESFIFPVFKLTLDGQRADVITWRWYVQRDGAFRVASSDVVQAMIRGFLISYLPAGGGPETVDVAAPSGWFGGGSIDFATQALDPTIDYSSWHVSLNFHDAAGNQYMWMQSNGGPGMAATIDSFGLEVRP